jgi:hypothetical protein
MDLNTSGVTTSYGALLSEVNPMAPINSAYGSLLSEVDGMYEQSSTASDEDIVCNTNLQTASLFRSLTEKTIALHKKVKLLYQDESDIKEIINKLHSQASSFKGHCMNYIPELIDEFQDSHSEFYKKSVDIQSKIMYQIVKQRNVLEVELDKLSIKLNALRTIILAGISELVDTESANNKKMCPICFDREVDMVMVPCGHTLCNGCCNYGYNNQKCAQCRTVIQKTVKMYFSL